MIDKIDGIKAIKKTLDFINDCKKENCIKCEFSDKCHNIIELAVDFMASINQNNTKFEISKI